MKKIILMLIMVMTISISCDKVKKTKTADDKMAEQTERSMSEANRQVGMPAIVNYQERSLAKMIFELRDQEGLICHAYLVNTINGSVGQYLGECIGYGLPYSVQFTNPVKYVHHEEPEGGDYGIFLPQADPNGLFMPTGLSATWLVLLDEKGDPHPVYIEPEIIVSPFKLHKDENK